MALVPESVFWLYENVINLTHIFLNYSAQTKMLLGCAPLSPTCEYSATLTRNQQTCCISYLTKAEVAMTFAHICSKLSMRDTHRQKLHIVVFNSLLPQAIKKNKTF